MQQYANKRKIIDIGNSQGITLPKEYVDSIDGNDMVVYQDGDDLVIRPVSQEI